MSTPSRKIKDKINEIITQVNALPGVFVDPLTTTDLLNAGIGDTDILPSDYRGKADAPFIHEVLNEITEALTFPVKYSTATDNGDGTYTLSGARVIHHLQPGFTVTIGADDFVVKDYEHQDCSWDIILKAGSNALPAAPGTFDVYPVYFFHGTPRQSETELSKKQLSDKTPMIYLMEPYEIEQDEDPASSICARATVTLCFLTQGHGENWLTDDAYHNAIGPMVQLRRDFMRALIASNKFYTAKQRGSEKYHTKFGITIVDRATKANFFSDKLSGLSIDVRLEMYELDPCICCVDESIAAKASVKGSFDDSFSEAFDI